MPNNVIRFQELFGSFKHTIIMISQNKLHAVGTYRKTQREINFANNCSSNTNEDKTIKT